MQERSAATALTIGNRACFYAKRGASVIKHRGYDGMPPAGLLPTSFVCRHAWEEQKGNAKTTDSRGFESEEESRLSVNVPFFSRGNLGFGLAILKNDDKRDRR